MNPGRFALLCWSLLWLLLLPSAGSGAPGSETPEERRGYAALFEAAAREFGVPADVLKGVAFAETRWSHLTWAEGDTRACNGMPRPQGIMSLWDDDHFGRSLIRAAALLGIAPEELRRDVRQNIRGGAALLRTLWDEQPVPDGFSRGDIESWSNAIAAYCGIPETDLAQQHALDVYAFMHRGYRSHGIDWPGRPVRLDDVRRGVRAVQGAARAGRVGGVGVERNETASRPRVREASTEQSGDPGWVLASSGPPDYPGAIWRPAYPGHWYTSGNGRHFVVIHDMEGYYLSTISYFQRSNTQASAHYCINGLRDNASDAPAGEITQMVEERHWAWHARCLNTWSLGIEHEGFASNPAWYTEEQYSASALLTRYLCDKYGIPKDRNHIVAHGEWQNAAWRSWMATAFPSIDAGCNNHTDPGIHWAWDHYMALVRGTNLPTILTQPVGALKNPGQSVSFSVLAGGGGPWTYAWMRDGLPLAGATNAVLVLTNLSLAEAGEYRVTVRNSAGSVVSEAAWLNISSPATPVGAGEGLIGGYFDGPEFVRPRFSRVDATVNFSWGQSGPAAVVADDGFSVRWVGDLEPRYSQRYTFLVRGDDAVRLVVDGEVLVDRWTAGDVAESRGTKDLVAGRRYRVRLDYMDIAGSALAELRWVSASQPPQVIPRTQWYPPALTVSGPASLVSEGGFPVRGTWTALDPDPTAGSTLWRTELAGLDSGALGVNGAVLFRRPAEAAATAGFLVPGSDSSVVVSNLPAGAPDGRAVRGRWTWATAGPGTWLQWTTADAAVWPNPRLDLEQAVELVIWCDRPVRLALGVRETETTVDWGTDGGRVGPIEWVGVTDVSGAAPSPSRRVEKGEWRTLRFDLPAELVRPWTGDGVLARPDRAGVLEHLAVVPEDGAGTYTVLVGAVRFVREHSVIWGLAEGDPSQVRVDERLGTAWWAPVEGGGETGTMTLRASNRTVPPRTAAVVVGLERRPSPWPTLRRVGADWEVRWSGLAGRSYRLERNSVLATAGWVEVGTVTAGVDGSAAFLDRIEAGEEGGATRFYRVVPMD